ncbi:hypothetical protein EIO60_03209|nr:hypothetical protein [Candidatus Pantoea persica]
MPVIQSVKVDWFQVITDLTRTGCSLQQIADDIQVAKSTLLGWKQGAEPGHAAGEALIPYWRTVLARRRCELPFKIVHLKTRSEAAARPRHMFHALFKSAQI